jgi:hypothetical protein
MRGFVRTREKQRHAIGENTKVKFSAMPILDCKPNAYSTLPERKWTISRRLGSVALQKLI